MRARTAVPLGLLGGAAGALGYAAGIERLAFRVRRHRVPVLPAGHAPIRLLQFSDAHLTPGQYRKIDWLRGLAALRPDLVVGCGDNLASPRAVAPMLRALEPLLGVPGVFVWGSNDYFAPRPKNPGRYLMPDTGRRMLGDPLPWRDLRAGLTGAGWLDLTHTRAELTVNGSRLAFAGVDDPHLRRDRPDLVAGPVPAGVDLAVGVSHSPEPRVLSAFEADGRRLLLAGHTHGGQLRVPGYGALVTNCGIGRDRARGLSRWGDAWLNVSAGLGTSPYTPVRFACPPEVSLLTLVAAGPDAG